MEFQSHFSGGETVLHVSISLLILLVSFAPDAAAKDLRTDPLRFDFTDGKGLQQWVAPGGGLEPTARGALLHVQNEHSSFLSPDRLEIDGTRLDRIEIDFRTDPPGLGGALFWTDSGAKGFVPEWKIAVPGGRSVLRTGERPEWPGRVDRFLLVPAKGARTATLSRFEVRAASGVGERLGDGWRRFWRTELRSHYSVNGIIGAWTGSVPFALLLGMLFVLLPILFALRGGRGFSERARRIAPRWLIVGTLLFLARAAVDEVRIAKVDSLFFGGRTLTEKMAAVNPPGFFPLILEAKRRIPERADVEFRAARPYPWEKGAFYLYPNRVVDRGGYVVSYRQAAPADSASGELLFRREGAGSVYRRAAR